MGIPIEDFFDGMYIVVEAMAFASTTAQGVPVKVPIPSPKPSLIEESTQTEKVGKSIPIPTEIPTPQKGVTPVSAS